MTPGTFIIQLRGIIADTPVAILRTWLATVLREGMTFPTFWPTEEREIRDAIVAKGGG